MWKGKPPPAVKVTPARDRPQPGKTKENAAYKATPSPEKPKLKQCICGNKSYMTAFPPRVEQQRVESRGNQGDVSAGRRR